MIDQNNGIATTSIRLVIAATLSLTFTAPPAGQVGVTWSVSSGSLPAGISLSADGTLSGTPTATGTSSFTVKVTDANSQTATQATSITISAGVSTTFTAPPAGQVGVAYTDTLTAALLPTPGR